MYGHFLESDSRISVYYVLLTAMCSIATIVLSSSFAAGARQMALDIFCRIVTVQCRFDIAMFDVMSKTSSFREPLIPNIFTGHSFADRCCQVCFRSENILPFYSGRSCAFSPSRKMTAFALRGGSCFQCGYRFPSIQWILCPSGCLHWLLRIPVCDLSFAVIGLLSGLTDCNESRCRGVALTSSVTSHYNFGFATAELWCVTAVTNDRSSIYRSVWQASTPLISNSVFQDVQTEIIRSSAWQRAIRYILLYL